MPIFIDNLDDPRITPYRNLKDRDLAASGDRFIAEGRQVVRRLLESSLAVDSVFVAARRQAEMQPLVGNRAPLYVVPDELVREIVGFKFHSGVLACGVRPQAPSIDDVMSTATVPATLMVLPEVANTENLGSMIRIAAAFGCAAVVLGERSCDPFYRQSVRVSMGTVFRIPIVRSAGIRDDLLRLKEHWDVRLMATVLDDSAQPLASYVRPPRLAVLFGNEAHGIPPDLLPLCDDHVTIPMKLGTDSLNVAVAAGVFLFELTKEQNGTAKSKRAAR